MSRVFKNKVKAEYFQIFRGAYIFNFSLFILLRIGQIKK